MNVRSLFGAVYRRLTANSALLCCLLLLVASCVLALKPAQEHSYQRFVPFPGLDSIPAFALDTKTGQECAIMGSTREDVVKQVKEMGIPFCIDLYKEAK
jgi:hypothetical protein